MFATRKTLMLLSLAAFVLCILTAEPTLARRRKKRNRDQEYYKVARSMAQRGRFADGLRLMKRVTSSNHKDEYLYFTALLEYKCGSRAGAIKLCDEVLRKRRTRFRSQALKLKKLALRDIGRARTYERAKLALGGGAMYTTALQNEMKFVDAGYNNVVERVKEARARRLPPPSRRTVSIARAHAIWTSNAPLPAESSYAAAGKVHTTAFPTASAQSAAAAAEPTDNPGVDGTGTGVGNFSDAIDWDDSFEVPDASSEKTTKASAGTSGRQPGDTSGTPATGKMTGPSSPPPDTVSHKATLEANATTATRTPVTATGKTKFRVESSDPFADFGDQPPASAAQQTASTAKNETRSSSKDDKALAEHMKPIAVPSHQSKTAAVSRPGRSKHTSTRKPKTKDDGDAFADAFADFGDDADEADTGKNVPSSGTKSGAALSSHSAPLQGKDKKKQQIGSGKANTGKAKEPASDDSSDDLGDAFAGFGDDEDSKTSTDKPKAGKTSSEAEDSSDDDDLGDAFDDF